MRKKHKHPNALAQARRRLQLSRRRVARLLRRHVTTIRKYEMGKQLPQLSVALQLEIVYRMPIAFLYPSLYDTMRRELRERETAIQMPPLRPPLRQKGGFG